MTIGRAPVFSGGAPAEVGDRSHPVYGIEGNRNAFFATMETREQFPWKFSVQAVCWSVIKNCVLHSNEETVLMSFDAVD